MRWLWVLLLAPSIVFAGVGTIEHDQGRTWNERSNKTENIDVGYDVLMDDFYQTGEDGQIGIVFEDDTTITVIENSELLIDDFVYDSASGIGQLAFNVTVGSFRYVSGTLAANNAGTVKITTPSATITVRGTTLTGNVTPGGATTITLLRDADGGLGMVTVANRAGSVNLTQPFHTVTVATINTRPPLPIIPTPAELGAMNLILEPIMDETPSQPERQEQHEEEEEEDDEDEDDEVEDDAEDEDDVVEDEEEAVEEDEEVEEEEVDEEILDEEIINEEEEVTEGDERDTEQETEEDDGSESEDTNEPEMDESDDREVEVVGEVVDERIDEPDVGTDGETGAPLVGQEEPEVVETEPEVVEVEVVEVEIEQDFSLEDSLMDTQIVFDASRCTR